MSYSPDNTIERKFQSFSTLLAEDPESFRQFWTFDEYWTSYRSPTSTGEDRLDPFASALVEALKGFKKATTEQCALKNDSFFQLLQSLQPYFDKALRNPNTGLARQVGDRLSRYLTEERASIASADDRRVRMPVDRKLLCAIVAKDDESCIMAAGYPEAFVVDLVSYLGEPKYRAWLVERFEEEIRDAEVDGSPVDCLCFVEKPYGGAGALAIKPDIARIFPNLSMITISQKGEIALEQGRPPSEDDVVCILYDLVYTGGGIDHVRQRLQPRTRNVCSVVLYDYGLSEPTRVRLDNLHVVLRDDWRLDRDHLCATVETVSDLSVDQNGRISDREWILNNWGMLEHKHPDRWIVVAGEKVRGEGMSLEEAMTNARAAFPEISPMQLEAACLSAPSTAFGHCV